MVIDMGTSLGYEIRLQNWLFECYVYKSLQGREGEETAWNELADPRGQLRLELKDIAVSRELHNFKRTLSSSVFKL